MSVKNRTRGDHFWPEGFAPVQFIPQLQDVVGGHAHVSNEQDTIGNHQAPEYRRVEIVDMRTSAASANASQTAAETPGCRGALIDLSLGSSAWTYNPQAPSFLLAASAALQVAECVVAPAAAPMRLAVLLVPTKPPYESPLSTPPQRGTRTPID